MAEALCRVVWINTGTTVKTQQSMRKSHPFKIFIFFRDHQLRDQTDAALRRLI